MDVQKGASSMFMHAVFGNGLLNIITSSGAHTKL